MTGPLGRGPSVGPRKEVSAVGKKILVSFAALAVSVVTFASTVQLSAAIAPQSVPSASNGGGGCC
jgi:hypothetical protein